MKEFTITYKAEITGLFYGEEEDAAILMHKDYPRSLERMMEEVEGLEQVHIKDLKIFMQEVKEDEPVD